MERLMKIELNDEQARVVIAALDAYSRLQMGQVKILGDVLAPCRDHKGNKIDGDILDGYISFIANEVFGYPTAASHGICSPHVPESANIAYDVQAVLQKHFADKNPALSRSVWKHVHQTCKRVPLATIEEAA